MSAREALSCACTALARLGIAPVAPELLRRAKYNQLDAVWRL